MNPVVGLDVAKGESQIQMFLDKKIPYKNSVKVEHTAEGLKELHSYLLDLERQAAMKPPIVFRSNRSLSCPSCTVLRSKRVHCHHCKSTRILSSKKL